MKTVQASSAENATYVFSARQFDYADADHARDAVLFEIHTLEQLHHAAPDSMQGGRLAVAFTRLGMIEESVGQADAAHASFDKARTWVKRSQPGADMNDAKLKDAVRRMDQVMDKLHR